MKIIEQFIENLKNETKNLFITGLALGVVATGSAALASCDDPSVGVQGETIETEETTTAPVELTNEEKLIETLTAFNPEFENGIYGFLLQSWGSKNEIIFAVYAKNTEGELGDANLIVNPSEESITSITTSLEDKMVDGAVIYSADLTQDEMEYICNIFLNEYQLSQENETTSEQ